MHAAAEHDGAAQAVLEAVADAPAKAETPLVVEEAAAAIGAEGATVEDVAAQDGALAEVPADVLEAAVEEQDEEQILEALIREEEEAAGEAVAEEETEAGFSVEDLAAFTLDDIELTADDDAGEEEEVEFSVDLLPNVDLVTPDAGKIRFAEDIVEEGRGSGRRDRKGGRRSGAGGRGARRGGR